MKNFFKITKYNYDDANYLNEWSNLDEFVSVYGEDKIEDYLLVEKKFIDKMLDFSLFFSNRLAAKIFFEDIEDLKNIPNYYYHGLILPFNNSYKKLQMINFNDLTNNQKVFLFQCHIRQLCTVHLIDVVTFSFLKPMHDAYYLWLGLDDSYNIKDIFKSTSDLYIYYDMDHLNQDDSYKVPSNFGQKLV